MPEMVNNLILNLKVSHAEALRLQCFYVVGNGPVSDPGSTVKGNFSLFSDYDCERACRVLHGNVRTYMYLHV